MPTDRTNWTHPDLQSLTGLFFDDASQLGDFTEVPVLGVSSSLALEEMILKDMQAGRPVYLVGASEQVKQRLDRLGVLSKLSPRHIVESRKDALTSANDYLSRNQSAPGNI